MVDPAEPRGARRVYIWGGALLLASAVGMAWSAAMEHTALLFDLYWALYDSGLLLAFQTVVILLPLAAALVFAFGSRHGGSVVAGSRVGIVAIAVFSVIPVLLFLLSELRGALGDLDGGAPAPFIHLGAYLIQVVAGIVAVREITRAGVIPRSRLWLPIVAVGFAALPIVMVLIGILSPGPSGAACLVFGLWEVGPVVLALTFGILALTTASKQAAGRVEASGLPQSR